MIQGPTPLTGEQLELALASPVRPEPDPMQTVHRILARRREFGITRLGTVTRLDRIDIPVAQTVRPLSLSVSVNQGKGLTYPQAAISALMESLEGWASERIAPERVEMGDIRSMDTSDLWSHLPTDRQGDVPIGWVKGWDIFSSHEVFVPLALVDTAYTVPSPHPAWLPRNTSGLAAGTSLLGAIQHACFELLERHSRCAAMRIPHFFDRFQVDSRSVVTGSSGAILSMLRAAGCAVGIWSIPTGNGPPVYWSHVMESDRHAPLAPWPAEGFGCDFSHDRALAKSLLEACQSRLGIISAAREDVTAQNYNYQDVADLSAWRQQLAISARPFQAVDAPLTHSTPLPHLAESLRHAGARAMIVVVLHSDESIPLHVVRVLTPPLETDPEYQRGA
ncbi:YcaO-like family protein [Paracoccus aestuariivivens]|uniref:YcaO domain-containing protein n=1 Tax=Paracoccus aestuariivivens TaxID=1820333 RepID=A0A6L6J7L5_9RHOB|nr:YcaO-like family protein [Paracoccus aestuariivivens]MTH78102.1 hypothetical protein [Paracoccus aestuariivivens]